MAENGFLGSQKSLTNMEVSNDNDIPRDSNPKIGS